MHERRISADEIDADFARRFIYCAREARIIFVVASLADRCNRRDRDSLIRDGYSEFDSDAIYGVDQLTGVSDDLAIDLFANPIDIGIGAVPQIYSHRHSTNVEMFHLCHSNCFQDLVLSELHSVSLRSVYRRCIALKRSSRWTKTRTPNRSP